MAKLNIMDNLPSELLAKIFGHLSDEDILNLPSKIIYFTLTEAKAQKLLHTMDVWLEKDSLERVAKISRHPILSSYVRELIFHNERLDNITPTEYLKSYFHTHHDKQRSHLPKNLSFDNYKKLGFKQTPGNSSLAANFGKYRTQLEDQKRIEEKQDDIRLLSIAFGHLLNLDGIWIDNSSTTRLIHALGDAWCDGVEQDHFGSSGSHLTEVLFKAMPTLGRRIPSFQIMHDTRPGRYYSLGLSTINFPKLLTRLPPNTVSSAVKSLQSLKLSSIHYGYNEVQFHDTARAASCGYTWGKKIYEDDAEKYGTTKAIAEMLSSATLLEELTLHFHADYTKLRHLISAPYVPLHSMRGSNNLQHLKELRLSSFKTRQDQLLRFLLKVAGTVTHLELDGILLDHGSWSSAFQRLRGRFQQLETLKIGDQNDLYDAGIGVHDLGPEDVEYKLHARQVSFDSVPCDDDRALRWLRDGTGRNPAIAPWRQY